MFAFALTKRWVTVNPVRRPDTSRTRADRLQRRKVVGRGRAKKYRHPWESKRHATEPVDAADLRHYVRVLADAIPMRFEDREQGHRALSADADVWLDPGDWERVVELVEEASTLMHASAKPPRTEGTVRANLSMIAFRMKPDSRGTR